jgi:hypothetical protein
MKTSAAISEATSDATSIKISAVAKKFSIILEKQS